MLLATGMKRQVPRHVWDIGQLGIPKRIERLLDSASADKVADSFFADALKSAQAKQIELKWQEASERRGYFRLTAKIPISEATFDCLVNGRSGYRAQYYLSPEEGVLYNRQLIDGLQRSLRIAHDQNSIARPFEDLWRTLVAPHAKVWVFDEQSAFDEAKENSLNPPRWVENAATRGRRAPLPKECAVDLKGAFLIPGTDELFVDDLKLSRPYELHCKGYT
jgi:hypothetical protein